jgi:hypothetical protein
MCPVIDNPTSCDIPTVIHFLHAKIMSAVEIHHKLCALYSQNVRHEGTVRQWCRMLRDWRTTEQTFMMKSKVVSQPSVMVMILFETKE